MSIEAIGNLFRAATPWVSLGVNLLSTVKQFDAAKASEKFGEYNREVFEREAAASWHNYQDRATIMQREHMLFRAQQSTAYSKAGVAVSGSAIEVLNDIVYQQELDQRALYSEAVVERASRLNRGAVMEWQAYQEGAGIRSKALSNFAATLMDPDIRYPWRSQDTQQYVSQAAGPGAPQGSGGSPMATTTGPNYTRAQANAVPGRRGWRPNA